TRADGCPQARAATRSVAVHRRASALHPEMSAPAEPKPGQSTSGDKGPRRAQRHRPHHQHYKRTSAIIDDRPDGKPILFNYGRHMTKLEKEQAKVMLAYSALATVVAICLSIVVIFAVYNVYISPN